MKANELRIGNIVYEPLNENKKAFKVFEIYHEEDYDKINYFNALNFEPVPLTEEWLVRFGFTKVGYIWTKWYVTKNINGFSLNIWETRKKEFLYLDLIPVNYVHSLQNLNFALSGEELSIKTEL